MFNEKPKVAVESGFLETEFPSPAEYIEKLGNLGYENLGEAYKKVIAICEAVGGIGGKALLVGGSVRDRFIGQISKDFDIEVYGLEPERLEEIVSGFGKVSDVGRAFGILKISSEGGIDIDVSVPRRDSKIGEGHRGFAVKTEPNMSVEDAARRRDFTINSMAADPLTGEIFDPFNGIQDLRERRLRVTDPERFRDDPLRVLRGLQFMARFGLNLEPETARIMESMVPELKKLPKERFLEEWKKMLLKSEMPSIGLITGMALGVFHELHPELPPLKETPQEKEWHSEGDVWIHTLMAVDEAAQIIRRENLSEEKSWVVMLATLAHDFGKPAVTGFEEGRLKSHGHESAGKEPAKTFLNTLGVDNLTTEKVIRIVVNHLAPATFYISEEIKGEKISDGAIRRLAQRIHPATIQELVLVAEADHLGRGPLSDPEMSEQLLLSFGEFPAGEWLLERARKINVENSKPADLIRGRQLIALGFEKGKSIGEIIDLANRLRDEKNFTSEMVFGEIFEIKDSSRAIGRLRSLLI